MPGVGSRSASIALFGEAPGFHEDRLGQPFVGKSGQRLNRWLRDTRLDRDDLFISNVLKCVSGPTLVRLPDGSTRTIREIVKTRYDGPVMAVDPATGRLMAAPVIGWHRSKLAGRSTYKLRYRHGKRNPKGYAGAVVTGDHQVLTKAGWIAAEHLPGGHLVATGEPAPGHRNTEQIIYGTLLGDACVTRQLQIAHTTRQAEWLGLKATALSTFGGNISGVPQNNAVSYCTPAGPYWRSLRERFYPDGVKIVPKDLFVGDLAWAVLYCDDGHLRERKNRRPSASIATNSFTEEEVALLCANLRERGVKAKPRFGSGWRIQMGVDATEAFAARVAKFIPPSVRYKLPPAFRDVPFQADAYMARPLGTFWDEPIVEPRPIKEKTVFCIDVAGVHNFVTLGGVLHNCRPAKNRFPEWERGGPTDRCEQWWKRQLQLIQPRAVILCGRQALHHILLQDTTSYADPFGAWVGKIVRRRDLYGDTRFGVLYHPSYILRKENPYEEQQCLDALGEIRDYVACAQRAESVPVIDIAEVRPARDLQHQKRFRLFQPREEPAP